MNIPHFTIVPTSQHPLRIGYHGVAVRFDSVAMKGRLDKVPLLQPRLSVVGQETVSKDSAVELESIAFNETFAVVNQNVLDKVGVVKEIDVTGKNTVVKDVTVLMSPLRI